MRHALIVPALMAMLSGMENAAGRQIVREADHDHDDWDFGRSPKTIDTGRRAEKDAAALTKAQRKRERKAAKRAAELHREKTR